MRWRDIPFILLLSFIAWFALVVVLSQCVEQDRRELCPAAHPQVPFCDYCGKGHK